MVDRFKVYQIPKRPEGKDEEWLAGKRVDTRGVLFRPTCDCFSLLAELISYRLLAVRAALYPYGTVTGILHHEVVTNAAGVRVLHKRTKFWDGVRGRQRLWKAAAEPPTRHRQVGV